VLCPLLAPLSHVSTNDLLPKIDPAIRISGGFRRALDQWQFSAIRQSDDFSALSSQKHRQDATTCKCVS
jgi:hypothetical protein